MPLPVPTPLRVRGAFVGAASGAVSIAAHAFGGGTITLGHSATALLLAGCSAVGVLATTVRPGRGPLSLMAFLALGQAIGHSALAAAPGHQHSSASNVPILVAHLLAIPLGALLIHTAEQAVRYAISRVRRAISRPAGRDIAFPWVFAVPTSNRQQARRLLLSSGSGTRGPPAVRV